MNKQKQTAFNLFFETALNKQQQKAVTKKKGCLLVIAGAGSGKTRVITTRIINLILNHGVDPSSIIALTFTNKAANEMRQRIQNFLGYEAHKAFIGTFHSYCLFLMRTNPDLLGITNFSILDEDDQQKILNKLIKRNGLDKRISTKQARYYISFAKNQLFKKTADNELFNNPLLMQLFELYEQEKKASKCFDFDDLLLEGLNLFKKHKKFKRSMQQNIRHILVDEYQDTNVVQHALLKQMALEKKNITIDSLCVVGDEDQSIYSWRGATVKNILTFQKDFPKTTVIKIEQNYRSVQPILHVANHVIEHNTKRNPKTLWSEKRGKDRVRLLTCISGYQEGDAIAQLLQLLIKKNKLSSCALLYRAHYQSRIIEEALIRSSIPYKIIGGIQFYERKEIKDLLAYLRLIANPFDRVSFFRVINCPQRGLGKKFEEDIYTAWFTEPLNSFYDITKKLIKGKKITGKKGEAVKQFISLLKPFEHKNKPSVCLKDIIKATAYFSYLKQAYDPEEAEAKIENIKELLRAVQHFEEQGINTVSLFLQEVALMQEKMQKKDTNTDRVQLMTLHAAKGLEFETVVLSGLEEGIFPSAHSVYQTNNLEEERRLLYVGITRAKERLLFMHARYRYTFGTMNDQLPSRFLEELPNREVKMFDGSHWNIVQFHTFFKDWLNGQAKKTNNQVITFGSATKLPSKKMNKSAQKMNFRKNQPIKHKTFGIGIIKKIEQKRNDTFITAEFKVGVKKIKASFVETV